MSSGRDGEILHHILLENTPCDGVLLLTDELDRPTSRAQFTPIQAQTGKHLRQFRRSDPG